MNAYLPEGRSYRTPDNLRRLSSLSELEQARKNHVLLEGMAYRCDPHHNLWVRLGQVDGVIPREETALGIPEGTTREIAIFSRVGHPVCFYVEGLEGHGGTIVPRLSRRAAQQEALEKLMATPIGTILPATVTHLEPFGAFVDLGCGVPSLIGLEQISVSRLPHPDVRFQVGQEIFVLLTGIDRENRRLILSHRELLGTWQENAAGFQVGEVVTGVVRSLHPYGAFIELTANLSGLADQVEGLKEGDWVSVAIKSIQPERMKLKLSVVSRLSAPLPRQPLCYHHTSGRLLQWQYAPEGCQRAGTAVWEVKEASS